MRDDAPQFDVAPLFLAADDGTLFSCVPLGVSADGSPRDARWKLIDATGAEYVGPPFDRCQSRDEVERLVAEWWKSTPTSVPKATV
jgi:hypothetical protein